MEKNIPFKIIPKNKKNIFSENILNYYENLHKNLKPQFAYNCHNINEHRSWEKRFRSKLIQLLGGFPKNKCPLKPQLIESVSLSNYTRKKIVFQSLPGVFIPSYVLVPHNLAKNTPAVIALPGHEEQGKELLVNIFKKGDQRNWLNYGHQYAKRGYIVIVIDQIGFGERNRGRIRGCLEYQESVNALMFGQTLIGLRVYDVIRTIDYLCTRPEVDSKQIGCIGISGGAQTTLFAAAIDKRIKTAVVSGYFCTFKDSIMAMDHCVCNYLPGILKYGQSSDIASLVAPRPLLIETGTKDKIFPTISVKKAYEKLNKAYKTLNAELFLDINIFNGGHVWNGRKSYQWIKTHLKTTRGDTNKIQIKNN